MIKKVLSAILLFVFTGFFANVLYAQQPIAPSPNMAAASELFKQQKFQEAAAAFSEVVKTEPENPRAWYLLGMSLHSLRKYEQAIAAFEKTLALAKNPQAMYNIACGFARLNQTDKAFEWLEKSLTAGVAPFVAPETDADLESLRTDARFKKMLDIADRQNARACILRKRDSSIFGSANGKSSTLWDKKWEPIRCSFFRTAAD